MRKRVGEKSVFTQVWRKYATPQEAKIGRGAKRRPGCGVKRRGAKRRGAKRRPGRGAKRGPGCGAKRCPRCVSHAWIGVYGYGERTK